MRTTDKQGRTYLQIDQARDGQTVFLDGGFTCHQPGPVHLHSSGNNAYFHCDEGRHHLEGQVDDEAGHCIGVYLQDPGPLKWEQDPENK